MAVSVGEYPWRARSLDRAFTSWVTPAYSTLFTSVDRSPATASSRASSRAVHSARTSASDVCPERVSSFLSWARTHASRTSLRRSDNNDASRDRPRLLGSVVADVTGAVGPFPALAGGRAMSLLGL